MAAVAAAGVLTAAAPQRPPGSTSQWRESHQGEHTAPSAAEVSGGGSAVGGSYDGTAAPAPFRSTF